MFTPEEKANAARGLNTAAGGDVTNPTLDESTVMMTDRDLKELHLRGDGGAKGPVDSTAPAPPPEEGPGSGPPPVVGPAPRGELSVPTQTVAPVQVAPNVNTSGAVEAVQLGAR